MKRRNFIVTLVGGLTAGLGIRGVAKLKPEVKAIGFNPFSAPGKITHTILPPPADRTGYQQYVTIDPANVRHAISYWASSDPPKSNPEGIF